MTISAVLSASSQKSLLDVIAEQKKQVAQKRKTHALWTVGLAIASAVLFVVCPPAGILAAAGPVAAGCALFGGALLAGDAFVNRNLDQAAGDAGKEGLFEKLAKKAERLKKLARGADHISTAAAFTIVGACVASLLFPPVAPVATVVFNVALWPMALGSLVNSTARDAAKSAAVTSTSARAAARGPSQETGAPAASAAPSSSPALTSAPGLKADFTGANAGAPAEKAPANDAAPAQKKNLAP